MTKKKKKKRNEGKRIELSSKFSFRGKKDSISICHERFMIFKKPRGDARGDDREQSRGKSSIAPGVEVVGRGFDASLFDEPFAKSSLGVGKPYASERCCRTLEARRDDEPTLRRVSVSSERA